MTNRTWQGRVFIGVSLDGYVARPDGGIDWLTDPPALGRDHQEVASTEPAIEWETFYPEVDHLVMGRGTYEKVLTFDDWPYRDKQVIVLSTTLADTDDRVRVARSLTEAIDRLEAGRASQVYVDGGRVVQAFLAAGLVDEITIGTAPVLIGAGRPLFGNMDHDVHLELRASHVSASGMVHTTYRVVPTPPVASTSVGASGDA